jgi:hypothetical protein
MNSQSQFRTMAWVLFALLTTASSASAGTIADAVAQPLGTAVTIDDALILSTVDLTPDPAYRSFQLRDVTRAITVYGTNAQIESALTGWAAGDGINIGGYINKTTGVFTLLGGSVSGFAVTGRTSTAPLPFPTTALTVTPPDIAQAYESDLVRLMNVSFAADGSFAAETDYALTGVSTLVRIATAELDLMGQTIPAGPVSITGVVLPDPAGDGYVLAPRGLSDIVPVPEPGSLALLLCGLAAILRRRLA